ncbi:MAG: hypothetical protein HZB38_16165 [Planctomycetes bacterium]|nr:hypothetical protein [Planctomycetota bacterium]
MSDAIETISQQRWIDLVARYGSPGNHDIRRYRADQRYDIEWGLAEVKVDGREREPNSPPLTMTLLEVSPAGVMLRSFENYPRETSMSLHIWIGEDEVWVRGTVKHSTLTLGGFKLGLQLEFEPVSRFQRADASAMNN